jgi:hypothetical protein
MARSIPFVRAGTAGEPAQAAGSARRRSVAVSSSRRRDRGRGRDGRYPALRLRALVERATPARHLIRKDRI